MLSDLVIPGFGSPIGASKNVVVVVDDSVSGSSNLVAGANESGFHYLNTNFGRDYDGIVADIASAATGYACPECGAPLTCSKGVEVGNIFQLGVRYSEAMGCYFQDEQGVRKPVIMGSYGIGIGRLLACLAEEYNDDNGLALPVSVAPYQVQLVSLVKDEAIAEKMYSDLQNAGIEVLFDDRKESPGVKFSDADLIGLPVRLTLGNRSLKEGKVEMKLRSNLNETNMLDISDLVSEVKDCISKLQKPLS